MPKKHRPASDWWQSRAACEVSGRNYVVAPYCMSQPIERKGEPSPVLRGSPRPNGSAD